ncbi:hypothetical protein [Streptacidiphilus rugosus]|uniref:hypothetical protein n=1 Tax=Streptacidiphilus rugosus TaxID=405783 RepID=UPI000562EA75|nr:hypothetical protein [Streptacidiphilus rugosus]
MFVLVSPVFSGADLARAFQELGADFVPVYSGGRHDADRLARLRPTAVIAASPIGGAYAEQLAGELDLPRHDPELASARSDLALMTTTLRQAGLPAVQGATLARDSAVDELLDTWNDWPAVVRPASGRATGVMRLCRTAEQARAAISAMRDASGAERLDMPLLLHGLPEGDGYEVHTVSSRGRHLVTEVRRHHETVADGVVRLRHSETRAALTAAEEQLVAAARACLDALGIREGAAAVGLRLGADGARPTHVQPWFDGPRQPDDPYFAALGTTRAHLLAESLLRPDHFELRLAQPYGRPQGLIRVDLHARPGHGRLRGMPGLNRLRRLPGFHSVAGLPQPGSPAPTGAASAGAHGSAYFVHEDESLLRSSAAVVHSMEDTGTLFDYAD